VAGSIPHIIHQTWRSETLPLRLARWTKTWRDQHPNWHYRFYTDADIVRTIRERASKWLPTFERLPTIVQRTDFFRYLVVYLDGGLYADVDTIAYKPSDALLENRDCLLSVEHEITPVEQRRLGFRQPFQLANCIFAAAPGHPFFLALLEEIARQPGQHVRTDDDVLNSTGPYLLTRLAYELPIERRGMITVLPQMVWVGSWHYLRVGTIRKQMYARHMGSGTWRQGPRITTWGAQLLDWYSRPSALRNATPEL
jgi:inositol phosphorylceramide mannosyltransferase catalytic subunit